MSRTLKTHSVLDFFIGRVFVGIEKVATNLSDKTLYGDRTDAVQQLAVLVEMGHILSGELSPKVAFEKVLDVLKQRHARRPRRCDAARPQNSGNSRRSGHWPE